MDSTTVAWAGMPKADRIASGRTQDRAEINSSATPQDSTLVRSAGTA